MHSRSSWQYHRCPNEQATKGNSLKVRHTLEVSLLPPGSSVCQAASLPRYHTRLAEECLHLLQEILSRNYYPSFRLYVDWGAVASVASCDRKSPSSHISWALLQEIIFSGIISELVRVTLCSLLQNFASVSSSNWPPAAALQAIT